MKAYAGVTAELQQTKHQLQEAAQHRIARAHAVFKAQTAKEASYKDWMKHSKQTLLGSQLAEALESRDHKISGCEYDALFAKQVIASRAGADLDALAKSVQSPDELTKMKSQTPPAKPLAGYNPAGGRGRASSRAVRSTRRAERARS